VRNFRFFPEYFPPSSNIHFLLHCSSLDSSLWWFLSCHSLP
jgi:hypothetical protein